MKLPFRFPNLLIGGTATPPLAKLTPASFSATSDISQPYTPPAAANFLVVIAGGYNSGDAVMSCTLNGITLTKSVAETNTLSFQVDFALFTTSNATALAGGTLAVSAGNNQPAVAVCLPVQGFGSLGTVPAPDTWDNNTAGTRSISSTVSNSILLGGTVKHVNDNSTFTPQGSCVTSVVDRAGTVGAGASLEVWTGSIAVTAVQAWTFGASFTTSRRNGAAAVEIIGA